MDDNFHKAVGFVLDREGGYTYDPDDPGGETNWGISKVAHPRVDIKNLTREGAIAIYRESYWLAMGCDFLPWPLDVVIFDTAVNQGPGYAGIILHKDATPVDLLFERLKRYSEIVKRSPSQAKYLRGWTNRILELYDFIKGGGA